MSVVAWDGKSIAADKQSGHVGKISAITKIRRIATGEVVAWVGSQGGGLMLAKWYEDGADPAKWPEFQKDKDERSTLIVACATGVKIFENLPIAITFDEPFNAWGSGQDFAVAAMAMGANAYDAVMMANRYSDGCGNGVDHFELTA